MAQFKVNVYLRKKDGVPIPGKLNFGFAKSKNVITNQNFNCAEKHTHKHTNLLRLDCVAKRTLMKKKVGLKKNHQKI